MCAACVLQEAHTSPWLYARVALVPPVLLACTALRGAALFVWGMKEHRYRAPCDAVCPLLLSAVRGSAAHGTQKTACKKLFSVLRSMFLHFGSSQELPTTVARKSRSSAGSMREHAHRPRPSRLFEPHTARGPGCLRQPRICMWSPANIAPTHLGGMRSCLRTAVTLVIRGCVKPRESRLLRLSGVAYRCPELGRCRQACSQRG